MNRIKELRLKKSIRQSDLAKYLNIAQNTLSYWEHGKYDVDNKSLQELALFFETTTDYILGLTNDPTPSNKKDSPIGIEESEEYVRLSKLIKQLTPENLEVITSVADGLIAKQEQ